MQGVCFPLTFYLQGTFEFDVDCLLPKSLDVTGSNEPFPFTRTYIGDFFHASWLLRLIFVLFFSFDF